ncbi:hypothetical protein [Conexibacter sp. W3-3-2]|uniref:hypothetical protein n=1 Tax=Conexibacter sp. W3-3-2 TaxID=2675227 RepID=UPI001E47BF80|nr:hypothetical protein [Conexibacter sp. W3-3-2]
MSTDTAVPAVTAITAITERSVTPVGTGPAADPTAPRMRFWGWGTDGHDEPLPAGGARAPAPRARGRRRRRDPTAPPLRSRTSGSRPRR